jgi:UDP-N-acetyl-D-mannosaminuronate dehydrogenase
MKKPLFRALRSQKGTLRVAVIGLGAIRLRMAVRYLTGPEVTGGLAVKFF